MNNDPSDCTAADMARLAGKAAGSLAVDLWMVYQEQIPYTVSEEELKHIKTQFLEHAQFLGYD